MKLLQESLPIEIRQKQPAGSIFFKNQEERKLLAAFVCTKPQETLVIIGVTASSQLVWSIELTREERKKLLVFLAENSGE